MEIINKPLKDLGDHYYGHGKILYVMKRDDGYSLALTKSKIFSNKVTICWGYSVSLYQDDQWVGNFNDSDNGIEANKLMISNTLKLIFKYFQDMDLSQVIDNEQIVHKLEMSYRSLKTF